MTSKLDLILFDLLMKKEKKCKMAKTYQVRQHILATARGITRSVQLFVGCEMRQFGLRVRVIFAELPARMVSSDANV